MKFAKKKAFTIVELLLAIALLSALLVTSGAVFRLAAKTHITAAATSEIARKLRGITDQLNADFKGLRKDAEIFIVNVPNPVDAAGNPLPGNAPAARIAGYERFDRIMFFADGDFQSYHEQPATGRIVRGNVARVFYMLAKDRNDRRAQVQDAEKRTLARSQHIFTADSALVDIDPTDPTQRRINWIDPLYITTTFIEPANNSYEYDNLTIDEWLDIPWADKADMLSIIADVTVAPSTINSGGLTVDPETPINVHNLMCEGVGQLSIQGWYDDPVLGPRWFPKLDLDDDGVITDQTDTDFVFDPGAGRLHDTDVIGSIYHPDLDDINAVPFLGRALKFTFTLYDSRGVFKEGKKFTHIVYLDE